jgi:hypothetical protein
MRSAQLGLWLKEREFDLFNQMFYKNFIQAVGYTKQKPISEFLIG